MLRAHEQTALPSFLVGWLIHHHGRRRDDIFIIDVGHHADDPPRLGTDADKLHHRIGPAQTAVQRRLPGKQHLRNALVDDHHAFRAFLVGISKIAALQKRVRPRFRKIRGIRTGTARANRPGRSHGSRHPWRR